MNLMEAVRSAFDGIVANKLRSFLTMLGVIIGVAAVIALVSIAEGSIHQITQRIEEMGSNLITIWAHGPQGGLTVDDVMEIGQAVPQLRAVAPELNSGGQVKWGLTTYHTRIDGVVPAQLEVRNRKLAWGRFISQSDVDHSRPVAVVGETTVNELFRGRDPVGQVIKCMGQEFKVVGVVEDRGHMWGGWENDVVMLPITAARRLMRWGEINQVYAQLVSGDVASETVKRLEAYLPARFGQHMDFHVHSQDEMLKQIEEATRSGRLMLGAIAGIALLVGGIGIMNIMLVSVTERTREIGLRKALGAHRRSILSQFLIEALAISLMGAMLGVGAGFGASRLINNLTEIPTFVNVSSVFVAVGFAACVGIVFGLWPAIKAARLQPIAALRYE